LSDLKAQFPKITLTTGSSEDTSFNLSQAVHNANIILTLVPTTTPLFNSVDVTSGTHLVLVGSYKPEMRDVDDELIKRGGMIIVDSKEACLKEAGEIVSAGLQSEDMVELGTILGKQGEDLRTVGDVTIFKSVSLLCSVQPEVRNPWGVITQPELTFSDFIIRADANVQVGLGIQDISIASLILEQAQKLGLGTIIENYD
jgi:ornithine cyclodeaminase/alanine dehydrogenase-like protein (mu-crystallin family)